MVSVRSRRIAASLVLGIAAVAAFGIAGAHSAICSCFDNGDGTVTCEGGFSDGSSAAGLPIRVLDLSGRVLIDGKMDDSGSFSFPKPDGDYQVVFDAGAGHTVTVDGAEIVE